MRIPGYRKHSVRDRAFVEWRGKRRLLPGAYNSRESKQAYAKFLHETVGAEPTKTPPEEPGLVLTVAGVFAAYLLSVESQYGKASTGQYAVIKYALKPFYREYGELPIAQLGPLKLKAWQKKLADKKLVRDYVNKSIRKIIEAIRWAVSEEMIPVEIHQALLTVKPLRAGQSNAKEMKKKQPVPYEDVAAIMPYCSQVIQAMVRLQWLTGARSRSIILARPSQFTRDGDLLLWRPRHKRENNGRELILPIGPQGQVLLAEYLARPLDEEMFKPKKSKHRLYRPFFSTQTYYTSVRKGIRRLNEYRRKNELPEIPYWSPHQIRHAKGRQARAEYGLEGVQAILGHEHMQTSEIYSERLLEIAKTAARKNG